MHSLGVHAWKNLVRQTNSDISSRDFRSDAVAPCPFKVFPNRCAVPVLQLALPACRNLRHPKRLLQTVYGFRNPFCHSVFNKIFRRLHTGSPNLLLFLQSTKQPKTHTCRGSVFSTSSTPCILVVRNNYRTRINFHHRC